MINLNQNKVLITKQLLLREISDLDIYRKYIPGEIKIGAAMLSPLRKETSASFGFFMGESGEICFKDHLLGGGDCIKFVQMKFNLTFFEALSKIATDFGFENDFICKSIEKTKFDVNHQPMISREDLVNSVTALTLGKNARPWALHDIVYWERFGISIKTLEHFNVQPIAYYYINSKAFKADQHAYCFIEMKDGKETYKFYQPFNERYKWINGHDSSVWQGWDQLPNKGDDLIITKSLKDVMAIYDVCGLPAISLQSENVQPKRHVFEQLSDRFEVKYLLYDNDYDKEINWGQQFAEKLASDLGLINIFIDADYKSKDFSDLVKSVGRDRAREILTKERMLPF